MMHEKFLPFTEQQLLSHFAEISINGKCVKNKKHLLYYTDSIQRYKKYLADNPLRIGKSIKDMKTPCQIEKDERFWTASCLMTIFYSRCRCGPFEP